MFFINKFKIVFTFIGIKNSYIKFYIYFWFFYSLLCRNKVILRTLEIQRNNLSLNKFLLLNFRNRQIKLNLWDLCSGRKYVYTLGLLLRFLNLYKKINKKNINFLKYLINYILKKYSYFTYSKKIIFILKGLQKNYIKLIYYFKNFIVYLNIKILLFDIVKLFKAANRKRKKSIKRRVYKKLIVLNR